jgi:hypothetical protein
MNQPSMMFNALPERLNAAIPTSVIVTSDLTTLPSPTGSMNPDPLEDIRIRAETVSKLLKEIMNHGTTRHWGIND